jgi:WD40 repeat protein
MQNHWLLAGDDSGRCSLFDLLDPDGKITSHNAGDFATSFAVGGSTDQNILSGSGDGNVRQWTHSDGTLSESTLAMHTDHVSSLCVDTKGEVAASVSWDGNLFFWNLGESPDSPLSLKGDGRELNSVAISPNAHWLAAAGKTGHIWVWTVPHCRLAQWLSP